MFHAALAIEWDKQVCGFLEHARFNRMLNPYIIQYLFVVERRVVGIILVRTHVHCRVDVERVELLGDFRNLPPAGLLGVVGSADVLRRRRNRVVVFTGT